MLAVGGSDRAGNHAAISATGPEMVVAAPAVDIVSTRPSGNYGVASGTSDATAIVAGVVALVRARYPGLAAAEVVRRIAVTATDRGRPGRDDEFGFGIVNPVAALTADVGPVSPGPVGSVAGGTNVPGEGGESAARAGGVGWVVGAGVVVVIVAGVVVARRRGRRD
ncbi:S8 family serine peptidase [Dactylosporangium sp. CA-092794]|uniref:S8 family serine peptidase n=1 Tax=Dactylosporangium sp. CA-092794 TaxID=3239929 RepID=UPI003D8CE1F5